MSVVPKPKSEDHYEERLTISSCVITQKPGDKYVNIERKSAEYKLKGNEPIVATEHAVQGTVHKRNLSKYFSDINNRNGYMFPAYYSSS